MIKCCRFCPFVRIVYWIAYMEPGTCARGLNVWILWNGMEPYDQASERASFFDIHFPLAMISGQLNRNAIRS
uniref:Putative secreted protein n=1 Tax=Anopheles darlingi TaxID=43151 RepID=A0A2M4D438_ANODA